MTISEHRRKQKVEWKKNNPEKIKAESAKYRTKHKEAIKERQKQYYQKNAEKEKIKNLTRYYHDKKYHPEKRMLKRAKDRARKKGIDFNITLEDIVIPTHCPIFGLSLTASTNGKHSNNSPSIDRIDPSKGYIKGNVIVISYRANQIKSNATPDELIKIATFFKNYEYDLSSSETIDKLSEKYHYE